MRPLVGLALGLLLIAAACGNKPAVAIDFTGEPKPPEHIKRIPDALKADKEKRFTTLVALVEAAGIGDALTGTGPVTLFAPTDSAFRNLPLSAFDLINPEKVASDEALRNKLIDVLKLHVVAKDVTFTEPAAKTGESSTDRETRLRKAGLIYVDSERTVESLLTGKSLVVGRNKTVKPAGAKTEAKIISADVAAPNGFIQVIDTVLLAS